MRTAYDVLHRALIKDFGKWWSFEWKTIDEEIKERLYTEDLAEKFWKDIFLAHLSDLCLHKDVNDQIAICGKQSDSIDFDSRYENNLKMLKELMTDCRYWVFSSFSFDDNFSLYGFQTKQEALLFWKTQKQEADDIFYSFWFRW